MSTNERRNPYVVAVKAWKAKHGRPMCGDDARAFGNVFDAARGSRMGEQEAAALGEQWTRTEAKTNG